MRATNLASGLSGDICTAIFGNEALEEIGRLGLLVLAEPLPFVHALL